MTDHFFLITIAVAVLVAAIYCITGTIKKKIASHSLTEVFSVIISTASFFSGIKLILNTFCKAYVVKTATEAGETDLFYTIIGGLAVSWLALGELIKRFRQLK